MFFEVREKKAKISMLISPHVHYCIFIFLFVCLKSTSVPIPLNSQVCSIMIHFVYQNGNKTPDLTFFFFFLING